MFSVTPSKDELILVSRRSTEGLEPREFVIDPSGCYVVVANQRSNNIMFVRREPTSDDVGETIQVFSIDTLSDLGFEPAGVY
jgi:6-phosphogluconolactonase (cycloisomerase 2 family)